MRYAEMQQVIAAGKHEEARSGGEIPAAEAAAMRARNVDGEKRELPLASQSTQAFRFYRLTAPIERNGKRYEYGGHVLWGGRCVEILANPVRTIDGRKEFEGVAAQVSGENLLRGATVQGDRSALPPDLLTQIEQAPFSDSLEGVGT